jgi:hypothetical protein
MTKPGIIFLTIFDERKIWYKITVKRRQPCVLPNQDGNETNLLRITHTLLVPSIQSFRHVVSEEKKGLKIFTLKF